MDWFRDMLRSSRVSYIDMLNEEIELVVKKIIKLSVKKKNIKYILVGIILMKEKRCMCMLE